MNNIKTRGVKNGKRIKSKCGKSINRRAKAKNKRGNRKIFRKYIFKIKKEGVTNDKLFNRRILMQYGSSSRASSNNYISNSNRSDGL